MATPATKKRKLENEEVKEQYNNSQLCTLDTIINTSIDDILGNEMDTEKLEAVSVKLQLLQNAIKIRIMNSISFTNMDTDEIQEYLMKFIECTDASVDDDDRQGYGMWICDVTTNGTFKIGPNKTELTFKCNLSQNYEITGDISMGNLWSLEIESCEPKDVNINLSEIKKLVKESGIKGIGTGNTNNNNNGDKEHEEYYKFTLFLSEICFRLIEETSKESCWYGSVNDLDLYALWDKLKCGDEELKDLYW
eukprot:293176_1